VAETSAGRPEHAAPHAPSAWVVRWAALIAPGARVLDLACGGGRHARHLAALGHRVRAVDRDAEAISRLAGVPGIDAREADLESGPWPCPVERFGGIVVTNYLHRPLLPCLLAALEEGGVLIYETFAAGNERYGRPSRPDHLLGRGELLEWLRGRLEIVAYEDVYVAVPRPARVQRVCAVRAPAARGPDVAR
jgi:SAM-dependent methyltransferase